MFIVHTLELGRGDFLQAHPSGTVSDRLSSGDPYSFPECPWSASQDALLNLCSHATGHTYALAVVVAFMLVENEVRLTSLDPDSQQVHYKSSKV